MLRLEARGGSRRWAVAAGARIKSRPRVLDGRVWGTGYDGKLHVVDLEGGSEVWSFSASGRLYSSPAVIGRTAFFGSMGGRFYAATWPLDSAPAAGGGELPAATASPQSSAADR